jgi:endonuclease-3
MTPRELKERRVRALKIAKALEKLFPEAATVLYHGNPWELVVAVILSAQTTDKKVNEVTKELFKKYRRLDDYARAKPATLAKDIYPVSFFRNKAKNIISAANLVKTKFKGKLPRTVDELTQLPGVGRKTANVVLSNLYGTAEGIMVDTHVRRFARKFDLTDYKDPAKIERDLMTLLSQRYWFTIGQGLVLYGQQICPARPHDCKKHPLTKLWPPAASRWPSTK